VTVDTAKSIVALVLNIRIFHLFLLLNSIHLPTHAHNELSVFKTEGILEVERILDGVRRAWF
jgi:hypothetical protein